MENKSFVGCNIMLRIVKPYPEAHNHIYTGRAEGYDNGFVAIDGCVLNFGRPTSTDPTGGLTISERALRWVALQRVEYIRELPPGMDPFSPEKFQVGADGAIVFPVGDRPDLMPD